MKTVGVRELKDRLSKYLRIVARGGTIRVTSHGKVVADLRPPRLSARRGHVSAGLLDLADEGVLVLGEGNDGARYPRLPRVVPNGTVEALLDEERGER